MNASAVRTRWKIEDARSIVADDGENEENLLQVSKNIFFGIFVYTYILLT